MIQKRGIKILLTIAILMFIIGWAALFYATKTAPVPAPKETSPAQQYTSAQQHYIDTTTRALEKLLEPLVGYGKVKISVSAIFNIQNQKSVSHEVIPNSAVIEREVISGTDSNPQQTVLTYAFSTKDTYNTNTLGVIQKQHISVVIDGNTRPEDKGIYQARTSQEMAKYTSLIKNATGYNPARGDTLEVLNLPFSASKPPYHIPWMDVAAIFVIAGIVFLIVSILGIVFQKDKAPSLMYPTQLTDLQVIQNTVDKNIHMPLAVIKNWIYMPEEKNNDWTGTQKASILLLALNDKAVRQILAHLSDEEVKKITKTMASLGLITAKQAERVFQQFNQAMQGRTDLVGNQARVHQILTDTQSKAIPPHTNPDLWSSLTPMDNQVLAEYLQNLQPEMTAFILYHQDAEKAAKIMPYFPPQYTTRVMTHLTHIGRISLPTHYKLEKQAEEAVKSILDRAQIQSGDKKASEILSHLDKTQESDIMSALYQQAPELAKRITRHLIQFKDIAGWSDETIRTLLRHTSKKTAAEALVGTDTPVQQAIARNVPPQVWSDLYNQITANKNLDPKDVAAAQDKIISTAQELLAQKQIHF